jgi:hypothetical protein
MRYKIGVVLLLTIMLSTLSVSAQERAATNPTRGAILGTVIGAAAGAVGAALIMAKPCIGGAYEGKALSDVVTPVGLIGGGAVAGYFIGRGAGAHKTSESTMSRTPEFSSDGIKRLAGSVRLASRPR